MSAGIHSSDSVKDKLFQKLNVYPKPNFPFALQTYSCCMKFKYDK